MIAIHALPPVLLVQGAWHHTDAWLPLRGALFLRGVRTIVTALPSAGTAPTGTMHDDARTIRAALAEEAGPVVVLAHSYGGIPATEATAGASNVARLIYLSAYAPAEDASLITVHGGTEPADTSGLFPTIDSPRTSLYADLSDEQAAAAEARLVDQSLVSFAGRVTQAGWRTVPTSYIVSDLDRAIPPVMQLEMARASGAEVFHLDSGHSPFLSMPTRLADTVVSIIRNPTSDQAEPPRAGA
jgi:pimeloyl-ACP methyl ester carboxylesterase